MARVRLIPSRYQARCACVLHKPGWFWPLRMASTARDLRYFSRDMGTSQHRMARHDQSRLACVGWRLCVQPTAIAPYHPIRVARLSSWLKARAKSSARVPKVARRRTNTPTILGGWASRDFTEVPTRRPASTELEPSEPDRAPDLIGALWAPPIEHQSRAICIVSHRVDIRCECA